MKNFLSKTILLSLPIMGVIGCKPHGTQYAVSGDAAQKAYVAPGKYD
jgi:nitrous-oxide reductase